MVPQQRHFRLQRPQDTHRFNLAKGGLRDLLRRSAPGGEPDTLNRFLEIYDPILIGSDAAAETGERFVQPDPRLDETTLPVRQWEEIQNCSLKKAG